MWPNATGLYIKYKFSYYPWYTILVSTYVTLLLFNNIIVKFWCPEKATGHSISGWMVRLEMGR